MVLVIGTLSEIKDISGNTLLFLILSGMATGASWLCYYRALQEGTGKCCRADRQAEYSCDDAFSWIVFHERALTESCCWCGIDHMWEYPSWYIDSDGSRGNRNFL